MSTTFKRGDAVMVADRTTGSESLGVIDRDFSEGDHWVRATAKVSPNSTSFIAPGCQLDEVRPATEADIAAAPDWAQAWLEEQRSKEQERLLDKRDPKVRALTTRGTASLRNAGIHRISDLARFTDKELLELRGVGKTLVAKLRSKQQEVVS